MTKIAEGDTVIYRVALNDHPLIVGEDDERPDEELVAAVEERTTTVGGLEWPGWTVMVSDPPGEEKLRYVNTPTRINVKARYWNGEESVNPFEAIAERVDIEDFDIRQAAMSHPVPTYQLDFHGKAPADFEGDVHLDLTDAE
jgi:hypothetical protein